MKLLIRSEEGDRFLVFNVTCVACVKRSDLVSVLQNSH